jgi:outer membrane protein OmpA-like peptidoglycan-associated protein
MKYPDFRQNTAYRRGLILGLTIAEVMILLIFVLLMVLAAALSNRERKIELLDHGGASRLVEEIQRAYPSAKSPDDYFKELKRAIDVRRTVEESGAQKAGSDLLEDAKLGRQMRDAARGAGSTDAQSFVEDALASARRGKRGQWPPFFSLSEAGGYYFDSGKATLRPEFETNLRRVVIPALAQNIRDYGVDVVEVIGHTDEVPMSGTSNLDSDLIPASSGRYPIGSVRSTDNAGLAMARAVSVVRLLRSDPRLKDVTILPLSGAQMIIPVDRVADGSQRGSDQSRRRIEIRLRRSTAQANATGMKVAGGH